MPSIKADLSLPSVIAKMGYSYNPKNSIYQVKGFTGFHQKTGGSSLCHSHTIDAIKKRRNVNDAIVFLGLKVGQTSRLGNTVAHSILVDSSGNVVADNNVGSNLEGYYKKDIGYFIKGTDVMLYKDLAYVPVKKFLEMTQLSHRTEEVSKVLPEVLDDALKNLYLIFAYSFAPYDEQTNKSIRPIPKALTDASKKWDANTAKFLTQFGIPKAPIAKVLKAARDNAVFTNDLDQTVSTIGVALFKARPNLDKDISIPAEKLSMLKDLGSAFRSNSTGAVSRLERRVALLKDSNLTSLFTIAEVAPASSDDQKAVFDAIKKLTKKYARVSTDKLSAADEAEMKLKHPEQAKEYRRLRTQARKIYENFVRDYVRRSGRPYVPYEELMKALTKSRIVNSLPTGFVGNIDEHLNLVTLAGKVIQGTAVSEVIMNPKYDPETDDTYVFKAKGPAGTNNIYTLDYIAEKRGARKEEKLGDMEENSAKYRGKWLRDLAMGGESRNRIMAAEVEIIYITAARTGNPGNATIDRATGETIPTHGITTLKVKHVVPYQGGYRISYDGKKLSANDYMILPKTPTNKRIIKIIDEMREGKEANDPLWTFQGKTIPTLAVANYFKSLGAKATLHTIRHMLGTKLAREILKGSPLKKGTVTQSAAEKWYKEALIKVGEALSHTTGSKPTSITAIKSYISPTLQIEFFKKLGLRTPAWLQIKGRS